MNAFILELIGLLEPVMADVSLEQLSELVLLSNTLSTYHRRLLLKAAAKVLPPKVVKTEGV